MLRPRSRRPALRLLASRQMAIAVPQPQPPQPEPQAGVPKWALGAGLLAVAAAALKLAWSFRRPPQAAAPAPLDAAAASAVAAAVSAPPAAAQPQPSHDQAVSPSAPTGTMPAAAEQAGGHVASSNGAGAAAGAASVGPVLLAAETAGVVDDTPTMTLEQLRSTATELYMLIQQVGVPALSGTPPQQGQVSGDGARVAPAPCPVKRCPPNRLAPRSLSTGSCTARGSKNRLPCLALPLPGQMELHLQEMSAELADRLPGASLAQLDELAAQLEEVEEKLAGLKVLSDCPCLSVLWRRSHVVLSTVLCQGRKLQVPGGDRTLAVGPQLPPAPSAATARRAGRPPTLT